MGDMKADLVKLDGLPWVQMAEADSKWPETDKADLVNTEGEWWGMAEADSKLPETDMKADLLASSLGIWSSMAEVDSTMSETDVNVDHIDTTLWMTATIPDSF